MDIMNCGSCDDNFLFNCELSSDLLGYSSELDLFDLNGLKNQELDEFFDAKNNFLLDENIRLTNDEEIAGIKKMEEIESNASSDNDDLISVENNIKQNEFVEDLPTSSNAPPLTCFISCKSKEPIRFPTIVVTKIIKPVKKKIIITGKISDSTSNEWTERDIKVINSLNFNVVKDSPLANPIQNANELILTEEEKRTLIAEGYPIPTKLPLTKMEEKALKKVQRKIKNKMSAQESRRKKKDYLESLERKLLTSTRENGFLKQRVEALELNNKSLLGQLQKLQQLLGSFSSNKPGVFMALILFMAVSLGMYLPSCPSFNKTSPDIIVPANVYYTPPQKSRVLLSIKEDMDVEHKPKPNDWLCMATIHKIYGIFTNEMKHESVFMEYKTHNNESMNSRHESKAYLPYTFNLTHELDMIVAI